MLAATSSKGYLITNPQRIWSIIFQSLGIPTYSKAFRVFQCYLFSSYLSQGVPTIFWCVDTTLSMKTMSNLFHDVFLENCSVNWKKEISSELYDCMRAILLHQSFSGVIFFIESSTMRKIYELHIVFLSYAHFPQFRQKLRRSVQNHMVKR